MKVFQIPFDLFFGRRANGPAEQPINSDPTGEEISDALESEVSGMSEVERSVLVKTAAKNIRKEQVLELSHSPQARQKVTFDKRHSVQVKFQPGSQFCFTVQVMS